VISRTLILLPALLLAAPASAADAALSRLKTDLAGRESATQVLTRWCGDLHLATPAQIRAVRVHQDKPATPWVRKALQVKPGERLHYRRVQLMCGAHILSEADNWYRPAHLTGAMNHILDTTDQSFGAVVRPLDFHRRTLSRVDNADAKTPLRLTAVLETPDGAPFSLVVENYRPILVTPPHHTR
jgi:chorismate-pyruvate lyase